MLRISSWVISEMVILSFLPVSIMLGSSQQQQIGERGRLLLYEAWKSQTCELLSSNYAHSHTDT